jgi:DNA modification methylase
MKVKEYDINQLISAEYNPRQLSQRQYQNLRNSIQRFGLVDPILINVNKERKNIIIGGHQRVNIAKVLGIEKVPCVELDLTLEQERELNIRLNQNTGDWDFDILADNFDLNELIDFGFEEKDLKLDMFEEEKEGLTDDDDIPEDVESVCKSGDLWKLGNHRLLCGDSTKKKNIELLLDGNKADMVFTDPPYELETQGGGVLKNSNSMKQIKKNKVDKFNPLVLKKLSKTNIYFHNKPLIHKYIQLSKDWNENYDLCVYNKTNVAPNYNSHLMTDIEYIAIIGDLNPNKGLNKKEYSKLYIGQKDFDNKLSYSKPVDLCIKFIKLYSRNSVLDIFLGSGSTLIACEKTNRICYGMELDPHYCDVIINRWEQYTGKKAELING